jgi:hypothetical protein
VEMRERGVPVSRKKEDKGAGVYTRRGLGT